MNLTRRGWVLGGLAAGVVLARGRAFAAESLLDRQALVRALRQGGFILLHRDTARMEGMTPPPAPGTIDNGARLSPEGEAEAKALGETYKRLMIPVGEVQSSQVFYIYQTATAAFGDGVKLSADLTKREEFSTEAEFETSVNGIRQKVATPPPAGTNIVLWTHRSKVEAAFGYYVYPGEIILFRPDPSALRRPNLVMVLSPKEFLALEG